jgi:hypothetical protein
LMREIKSKQIGFLHDTNWLVRIYSFMAVLLRTVSWHIIDRTAQRNASFIPEQNCSIVGCQTPHRTNSFAALLLPNPLQYGYCLIHKFTYMLHRYAFSRVLFSSALGTRPIGGEGGCCAT